MKSQKIISLIILVCSIALCIISFIVLPEKVVTQISIGNTEPTTMPKIIAIIIPSLLGIGGALISLYLEKDSKTSNKALIVGVVGLLVFIVMLFMNK